MMNIGRLTLEVVVSALPFRLLGNGRELLRAYMVLLYRRLDRIPEHLQIGFCVDNLYVTMQGHGIDSQLHPSA